MNTNYRSAALCVFIAVLLAWCGSGGAEMDFAGGTLSGEAELGWIFLPDEPSGTELGKFREYRDIDDGPFGGIYLQWLDKQSSNLWELQSTNAGYDDQTFLLRASRVGLFNFEFQWDQIPHVYSITPRGDEVDVRRDSARFSLELTPTPEWDIEAEYTFTDRHGDIPRGVSNDVFAIPLDAFAFEKFLQPVEYTDHDARISAGLAKEIYQLQLSYNLSLFENDISSAISPQAFQDGIVTGDERRDRVSLPPDNMAHIVTLAGGVNLPYRTRLNGAFSYSLHLQDEDLLPPIPTAGGATIPVAQPSEFDGRVNTYLLYLAASSRPLAPLTLKAKYRLYSYDDQSDEISESVDLLTDQFTLLADRYPYTKHTAGVDARWQFELPVSVNLSYNWEFFDREESAFLDNTSEHTPKIAINATPLDWLALGISYTMSFRDREGGDEIFSGHVPPDNGIHNSASTNCLQCHAPVGQFAPGFPASFLFNKFNMTDRDRDKVELFVEITPRDAFTVTPTVGFARDEYKESSFGLLEDENWSAGVDVVWRPVKRVAFSANYLHEQFETKQLANELFADFDPGDLLTTQDVIDTFGVGVEAALKPDKLDLELRYNVSFARSDFKNGVLPELKDTFGQYQANLKYRFAKHWTAKLGYIFEDYDITQDYTRGGGLSTSLLEYYDDYTAHIVALSMLYRF